MKIKTIMHENEESLTVSELTTLIKNTINTSIKKKLCIIGEISNFKLSKNNLFFTLKDEDSMINVIYWNYLKSEKNKDEIEDGKKVKIFGNLNVFGKSGSYNLTAFKIELIGIGNLYNEYTRLKNYYSDLGYFDDINKKKLPININKIGLLTAIDGAALQDFLFVLKKNNYIGELFIKNSIVQGKDCPFSIKNGLKLMDQMNLDVIVLARGGGSFEDLFGFSNNLIIESINETKTCVISAIGHETDFMLSDFASDIRAPTPSIAADIVSNYKNNNYGNEELNLLNFKLEKIVNDKIFQLNNELTNLNSKLCNFNDLFNDFENNIKFIELNLENKLMNKINIINEDLNKLSSSINKENNPLNILSNGYCLVSSLMSEDIKNINDFIKHTNKKKKLKLKFIDGEVTFDIRSIKLI